MQWPLEFQRLYLEACPTHALLPIKTTLTGLEVLYTFNSITQLLHKYYTLIQYYTIFLYTFLHLLHIFIIPVF